jgi:glycosyltransferase involved in cell wall biosynthesis
LAAFWSRNEFMTTQERRIIALLGNRDHPTDALEEYCRYLSEALQVRDIDMELARVEWTESGWSGALRVLAEKAKMWRGLWVLLQYTALGWSKRGFPFRIPRVVRVLRAAGTQVGFVFHDVEPYSGTRVMDSIRRTAQIRTMQRLVKAADAAIFTVPTTKLSWKVPSAKKVIFIPVGANLPIPLLPDTRMTAPDPPLRVPALKAPTVAVFGITGGAAGKQEIADIAGAVRFASGDISNLRLTVLGRNSHTAESGLREALGELPVEVRVLGVLPADEVVRELCASDVLLFVRGGISSRRGSAIAGIACGLPVIGFEGLETAPPLTEAGVVLVDARNQPALGAALRRVLTDAGYRAELARRNRDAHEKYFAWDAIAARYDEFLD